MKRFAPLVFAGLGAMFFTVPTLHAGLAVDQVIVGGGARNMLDANKRAMASVEARWTKWVWGFRPWVHADLTNDSVFYVGAGLAYTFESADHPWGATFGVGPGYYHEGSGSRLGGEYQNCSFAEFSYRRLDSDRVSVRFAHLSNGGIHNYNPGTEMLTLQYSVSLR